MQTIISLLEWAILHLLICLVHHLKILTTKNFVLALWCLSVVVLVFFKRKHNFMMPFRSCSRKSTITRRRKVFIVAKHHNSCKSTYWLPGICSVLVLLSVRSSFDTLQQQYAVWNLFRDSLATRVYIVATHWSYSNQLAKIHHKMLRKNLIFLDGFIVFRLC